MLQDIGPHQYWNEYKPRESKPEDYLLIFENDTVLLCAESGADSIPQISAIERQYPMAAGDPIYLFRVDDRAFYFSPHTVEAADLFHYQQVHALRELEPSWMAFAGATALHLARWYDTHRYCGKCANLMTHKETERALFCSSCGIVEYPKIAPVVIVGITDGDKILLSKYSHGGYKKYALLAGFMEIGETLEDTIRREVMEEVGLQVDNIRYYKSQPWAFSESVLIGFFADVVGDRSVHIDKEELSEAAWFTRESIPEDDSTLSLTWDMIEHFRKGNTQ